MNRLGIQSLNAGAPDLRLSGDQTQRGTYVQRRRAQMAGGGIMGSNAGSMLVAPTADGSRPGYAWYNPMDWIPNEIKDPIAKLIPNELKNPATAIVAGSLLDKYGLPDFLPGDLGQVGEGWLGKTAEAIGDVPYVGKVLGPVAEGVQRVGETIGNIPSAIGDIFTGDPTDTESKGIIGAVKNLPGVFPADGSALVGTGMSFAVPNEDYLLLTV